MPAQKSPKSAPPQDKRVALTKTKVATPSVAKAGAKAAASKTASPPAKKAPSVPTSKTASPSTTKDKKAAAEFYLKYSKDKDTVQDILAMLNDPQIEFTQTPKNITRYADFLYKIDSIKQKPTTWKDLFFPEIHGLSGS